MYQLNSSTIKLIQKTTKGKKFIKLNIGFMIDNQVIIKTFGETDEIDYENNVYEIGSLTKTFTASILAKYVYENKMRLNDSIEKYISGLNPNCYYPSLQRLATHTAGYSFAYPLTVWEYLKIFMGLVLGTGKFCRENPLIMDYNKMLEIIKKNYLKNRDYKWQYSNFGISLLGYAISSISESGYWNTMEDFLTNELSLQNTYLGKNSEKNLKGFNSKNEDCGNWKWDKTNLIAPAGAISSTAEDLLAYAKANMYDEKPYLSLCHQKYTNKSKNTDMGLVWELLNIKNNHVIWDDGGTGCFASFLGFNKEKRTAAVVLSNYISMGINKIGFSILENMLGCNE